MSRLFILFFRFPLCDCSACYCLCWLNSVSSRYPLSYYLVINQLLCDSSVTQIEPSVRVWFCHMYVSVDCAYFSWSLMFFYRSICVDCSFYFPFSFTLSTGFGFLCFAFVASYGVCNVFFFSRYQSLYASCICLYHMYGSVDCAYFGWS